MARTKNSLPADVGRRKNKREGIGIVGIGAMGRPLAERFLKAGYEVYVWNRTPSRAADLVRAGATLCESPRQLMSRCHTAILAVTDESAVKRAIFDGDGLVEGSSRRGSTIIDTSTIGPKAAIRISEALARSGVEFLDAPVSGGAARARDGTLCVMVGGKMDAFQRSRRILELIGSNVYYMGESGAGQSAKLVNQVLVSINALAAAESLILASSLRTNLDTLIEVLKRSSGDSNMFRVMAGSFTDGDFDPDQFIHLMKKDLELILDQAEAAGRDLRLARLAHDIYSEDYSKLGVEPGTLESALRK